MKIIIKVACVIFFSVSANANIAGKYTNPEYDTNSYKAFVEISEGAEGSLTMKLSVSCGSKTSPAVLSLVGNQSFGRLETLSKGSYQCYSGEHYYYRYDDKKQELRVFIKDAWRFPNFSGIYTFSK